MVTMPINQEIGDYHSFFSVSMSTQKAFPRTVDQFERRDALNMNIQRKSPKYEYARKGKWSISHFSFLWNRSSTLLFTVDTIALCKFVCFLARQVFR